MTEPTHPTPPKRPTAGAIHPESADAMSPDRRDLLISRIIDAQAGAADWQAFRAVAERDGTVWRDLAEAQRQHELLCEGLRDASACADRVDLPEFITDGAPLQRRFDGLSRWGGWAAAAALVLVWATGGARFQGPSGPSQVQNAGLINTGPSLSEATPEEALGRYIDAGRHAGVVVGELPDRVVVETRPRSDGSIEVVYLRQFIERRVTDQVYRESVDETGRLVPVAIPAAEIQVLRAY